MEVFSKYFRRLLVGNSPQIFPGTNRNVENPSNYHLLVQEMEKITQDPEQAPKIAEIIDTSEGDIFRDFELATFMNHFGLDPLAKTLLASAFTHVSKTDLKAKGISLSPHLPTPCTDSPQLESYFLRISMVWLQASPILTTTITMWLLHYSQHAPLDSSKIYPRIQGRILT